MRTIIVLFVVGILLLERAIVAYANSPTYLPLVQNGPPVEIVDAAGVTHRSVRTGEVVRLLCSSQNGQLVITNQTGTSVTVTCVAAPSQTPVATALPTSTPTKMPTPSPTPSPTKVPTNVPTATPTKTPVSTPSPVPTAPTAPQPIISEPGGQSGEWDLVFSDEFNGTSLDLNKWEPSWFAGSGISKPINTDEDGCYGPSQVSVSGGTLNLRAEATTLTNCLKRNDSRASYISGLVNTRKGFTYTYGFIEARIFLPGSNGSLLNWPAWWSTGTGDWPTTGEIDVMEGLSTRLPCWHYHYEDSNGDHQAPGGCPNMDGTGWHTYGALWEEGEITYYYDGVQVAQINEGIVDATHFLILNYGINDRYGITVPSTMQVDYVRVWKP